MSTALIVKSTDSNGKAYQKTVTAVNPDVSNENLATFGQMVNALTTHTYSGTDRVDKINCDTEVTPEDTRQEPTLTLAETSKPAAQAQTLFNSGSYDVETTYTGDGTLSVTSSGITAGFTLAANFVRGHSDGKLYLSFMCSVPARLAEITEPIVFTVKASGTETYKPAEITFTFTV